MDVFNLLPGGESRHRECRDCGENLPDDAEECPSCGGEPVEFDVD